MANDVIAEYNRLKDDSSLQVEIDGETYWIVEGDLLIDKSGLLRYARRRVAAQQQSLELRDRLLAETDEEGRIKRWAPGLTLSYAVLKDSFSDLAQYAVVVQAMETATNDWEAICGVTFEHRAELDEGGFADDQRPLFLVEWRPQLGNLVALAFFPDDPPEKRVVMIFSKFFNGGYKPAGILRHELGHVLGFRHEHIRSGAPPQCPQDAGGDANTFSFGAYDPNSVMHYFCGGVGDPQLNFTEVDRAGARALYGPPHHEVRYYQ